MTSEPLTGPPAHKPQALWCNTLLSCFNLIPPCYMLTRHWEAAPGVPAFLLKGYRQVECDFLPLHFQYFVLTYRSIYVNTGSVKVTAERTVSLHIRPINYAADEETLCLAVKGNKTCVLLQKYAHKAAACCPSWNGILAGLSQEIIWNEISKNWYFTSEEARKRSKLRIHLSWQVTSQGTASAPRSKACNGDEDFFSVDYYGKAARHSYRCWPDVSCRKLEAAYRLSDVYFLLMSLFLALAICSFLFFSQGSQRK